MAITIPGPKRILNRTPVVTPFGVDPKTSLDATNVMLIFDDLVNGAYRSKLNSGTSAERPASPEPFELRGNTDFDGIEIYLSGIAKWQIVSGVWTNVTKPGTTDLAPNSKGWNVDLGQEEYWDGITANVWSIR